MNNKAIPAPVIAAVVVVVAVLLGFFLYRAVAPPATGGNYTPGVPPWLDPKQKGNAPAAPAAPPAAAPAAGQ